MKQREWTAVGYAVATVLLVIGITFIYMVGAGIPIGARKEVGLGFLLVGGLFCICACTATSFFSAYAWLGQDIELAAR